ncbi:LACHRYMATORY-FACTOR SYNTHASE [Salix purpurea]|uniref:LACHRYMATORY-FACTOR SYNTHASE n=1 Tax=Salix purpurea TaxID=77065 RepID=A0A9Q0T2A6_SALPP|nr:LACHRYMATORY-FACTOR SYNTHASE [Salix purpurea]
MALAIAKSPKTKIGFSRFISDALPLPTRIAGGICIAIAIAMHEETQGKWEGKATAELKGPTADQVWPFFEDFCNLQKWLPGVDTCYQVEGEPGQPGLVRYCSSSTISSDRSHEETQVKWVKEKLVMIDRIERCLSYEIIENNVGFKSYVATIKVLPINDGCKIEWSYVADPIEGWPVEDFNSYISSSLQFMGQKMEQAALSG